VRDRAVVFFAPDLAGPAEGVRFVARAPLPFFTRVTVFAVLERGADRFAPVDLRGAFEALALAFETAGLRVAFETTGLRVAFETARLRAAFETAGLRVAFETAGLRVAFETAGLRAAFETAGLRAAFETAGLRAAFETAGLRAAFETAGLRAAFETALAVLAVGFFACLAGFVKIRTCLAPLRSRLLAADALADR